MAICTPNDGPDETPSDFRRMLDLMAECMGGNTSQETKEELRQLTALPHIKANMRLVAQLLGPPLPKTSDRVKVFVDQVTTDSLKIASQTIQTEPR